MSGLVDCLLGLTFVVAGLYIASRALVPSWRKKVPHRWEIYAGRIDHRDDPKSWLVRCGFVKPRFVKAPRLVAEGDFDEKTAIWVSVRFGMLCALIGIGVILLGIYGPPSE